jgi:hypothetical protein
MRLAGLQLVEEFAAPLLLHFLRVWGQKQPLDYHMALHSQVILHQVPHWPWVLGCLTSCLMLRRGFSATTTWTAVMAAAVRTLCLLLASYSQSWAPIIGK